MRSLSQQNASRANGAQSQGPTSDAGKQVSRFNALRGGLRAAHLILPGEDENEFAALHQALVDEWKPTTPTEEIHVRNMAVDHWKQLRAERWEATLHQTSGDTPNQSRDIDRAWQAQLRFQRAFARSQRELLALRKATQPPKAAPEKRKAYQPLPFIPPVSFVEVDDDGNEISSNDLPARLLNEETGRYEDIHDLNDPRLIPFLPPREPETEPRP